LDTLHNAGTSRREAHAVVASEDKLSGSEDDQRGAGNGGRDQKHGDAATPSRSNSTGGRSPGEGAL
jgi:hypothetical protein